MCLEPERTGTDGRIDTSFFPPRGFIATAMHLAMMTTAERDRELIADLTAECRRLREPQMMGVCRATSANEAWLFGDGFHMLAVADPAQHGQRQDRFVDTRCPI